MWCLSAVKLSGTLTVSSVYNGDLCPDYTMIQICICLPPDSVSWKQNVHYLFWNDIYNLLYGQLWHASSLSEFLRDAIFPYLQVCHTNSSRTLNIKINPYFLSQKLAACISIIVSRFAHVINLLNLLMWIVLQFLPVRVWHFTKWSRHYQQMTITSKELSQKLLSYWICLNQNRSGNQAGSKTTSVSWL